MGVLIADLIVAWGLFIVLKTVDANVSLLAMLFRAAYTIAYSVVVLGLLSALSFAKSPPFAEGLGAGAPALSYHFLANHSLGFTVMLIFFGVHLILLGSLIVRSRFIPAIIGWIVALAGIGYTADGFGTILLGSYGAFSGPAAVAVIAPSLIGEGALMLWLLIRGVDKARFPETEKAG